MTTKNEALDSFFAKRDWALVERLRGWRVRRVEAHADLVLATMRARDTEEYLVLLGCDGYPQKAPSAVFVDANMNKLAPTAWPRGNNAFHDIVKPPPNCFLCTAITREGLAHHPDWRTSQPLAAWNPDRHTLLDVLHHVQRLLDSTDYEGRGR